MKPGIYMLFAAVLAAVMTAAAGSARAGTLEWLQPPGAPGSPPKKVISLAPSITEILFEVGSGGAVAGATRYDDWPPEARKIKRVGGYLDADIEAIIAMKPDAVFCEKNSGVKNTVEKLASLGIPVGVVSTPDMGSILSATEEIGAAMGRAAAGKQSAASMRARLGAVESAVRGLRRPGVLVLYNIAPPMAAGAGSFSDSAITTAGGLNLAARSPVKYPVFDVEKLAKLDPDVIIDQSEVTMESSAQNPLPSPALMRWKNVRAVAAGKVYTMPGAYMFRPGPRIVGSVEMLARLLHPEAFDHKP